MALYLVLKHKNIGRKGLQIKYKNFTCSLSKQLFCKKIKHIEIYFNLKKKIQNTINNIDTVYRSCVPSPSRAYLTSL